MVASLLRLWVAASERLQHALRSRHRIRPGTGGVKLHCSRMLVQMNERNFGQSIKYRGVRLSTLLRYRVP
jgi:hypothetical protein